jgi:uncharacterized membrane protein YraQ (UPF0718 family)
MHEATSIIIRILEASWAMLLDAAPFVLLGFFVAGLFKAFMSDEFIGTHLGGNGIGSILKASAIGVPIPLCSCGVLPAAAGLRKQGAGKGPVASFLISTPETGVDSIAISWALLDPVMTIVRPVAGFITAVAAGVAVAFSEKFGDRRSVGQAVDQHPSANCSSSCCCGHAKQEKHAKPGFLQKLREGLFFSYGDLLKDVGPWLFFGVLLAGSISVMVPPETMERFFSNEYLSMLLMLAVSVPLYVCATASTPIAAAFALKGISPGAALIFLLAGPATNAASLTVISRMIGKRATAVYLAAIIIVSFIAGIAVNSLYGVLGLDLHHWVSRDLHENTGVIQVVSVIVLFALVLKSLLPLKGQAGESIGHGACEE